MRGRVKIIFILFCFSVVFAQKRILIRCDDIGLCHSVNVAAEKLVEAGIRYSASVMTVCPWFEEAVKVLKDEKSVSVGVHLTLTCEWKFYKWGPIAGKYVVPSLVNRDGYFSPTVRDFVGNNPVIREAEVELREQIKRALEAGLKIDYVDYHMGAAIATPELQELVYKLAREYKVGISRCFGEVSHDNIWGTPIELKLDSLIAIVDNINDDKVHLIVIHPSMNYPEMDMMEDINSELMYSSEGKSVVGEHRSAELEALLSPKFREALKGNNIKLINYRDLISEVGLDSMKKPEDLLKHYIVR